VAPGLVAGARAEGDPTATGALARGVVDAEGGGATGAGPVE
jgi:hypothetical protein